MPASRLRLQMAGWFALAFVGGLLLLSLTLSAYMRHQSDLRFTRSLDQAAGELIEAIRIEYREAPDGGVRAAAAAVAEEWPTRPMAFAVYDSLGRRVRLIGPVPPGAPFPATLDRPAETRDLPSGGEHATRVLARRAAEPAFAVAVAASTEPVDEDAEALAFWLAASVPVVVLLSLLGGYVLSRRALRPVGALEEAIAGLAPDRLGERLPVRAPADELDRLAARFNDLLARLEQSQARNRRFLQEAAHQLRTPLTLVLGETELALERPRTPEAQADALRRVRLAAGQMRRRVEELFLLAHAEAGDQVPLTDDVELDGLLLECADLMRGRAQGLGRRLALDAAEPATIRGSEPLLREAVLELLENACRHGGAAEPIRLGSRVVEGHAELEVANVLESAAAPAAPAGDHGLGLQVVEWIVGQHRGRLVREASGGRHRVVLRFPLAAAVIVPSSGRGTFPA